MKIIGRQLEQQELQRIYESDKSEFLMVYGRRRVGKTFLIREYFKNNFDFYITGIAQGSKKEQLMNFRVALNQYDDTLVTSSLSNWFEAFDYLKQLLSHSKRERKIVFLDELQIKQGVEVGQLVGLRLVFSPIVLIHPKESAFY
jgi:AAA+ ATPase superfamily predicted ATPase